MNRRGFLGSILGAAGIGAVATSTPPISSGPLDFSRLTRRNLLEWRGRTWWLDKNGRLHWAWTDPLGPENGEPEFDWLDLNGGIQWIAVGRDRLWLHAGDGAYVLRYEPDADPHYFSVHCVERA